jgi:glyoxylase I family protein
VNTPGLNHVILTVSNLEQSRAFYGDLLGFEIKDIPPEYGNLCYFMVGNVSIWLITHEQTPPHDRFSEFRLGLDHLAFSAPDAQALHDLVATLRAAGADTTDVKTFHDRWLYVVFRDPDNIQLEYWLDEPIEQS